MEKGLEGGGKARECKPSWRPNPSRLRVHLGVQDRSALNWTPRTHKESDLDVLYMVGIRIL
jgi:hypothetical protein